MSSMKEFMDSIRTGVFRIPVCTSCHSKVWPPSHFCPFCYSPTSLENLELVGRLIEFASSHVKNKEGVYGVVDVEGVRVVGSFGGTKPRVGARVKLTSCGVRDDGSPFYNFDPA